MNDALGSDSQSQPHEAVSTLGDILLDKDILLESGTNELEALVFDVADFAFAINVAKVREVLTTPRITALAKSHPSIRGAFSLRERVIPCISLATHLSARSKHPEPESHLILTEVNQQQTAFLVDEVHHIHRISWEHILPVPDLHSLTRCPVTALAHCNERLVLLLDFEKVLDDVTGEEARLDRIANPHDVPRETMQILMIEDSPTVRDRAGGILRASGYERVLFFNNGAEAWQWLEQHAAAAEQLKEIADLVISDVEMPQIDGFHLTKQIKQHPVLSRLPVLLYSSIITPDNYKKGNAVGADAQITKPELDRVAELADKLISGETRGQQPDHQASQETPTSASDGSSGSDGVEVVTSSSANRDGSETKTPPAESTDSADNSDGPDAAATDPPASPMPETSTISAGECPPPNPPPDFGEVELETWERFYQELIGKVGELREMIERPVSDASATTLLRDAARALHSIKAAAHVIPVTRIVQRTHQLETRLESCHREHHEAIPRMLQQHADWLESLVQPENVTAEQIGAVEQFAERVKTLEPSGPNEPA